MKRVAVKKAKIKYPLAEKFLYILQNDTSSPRHGELAIIYFQLFSILTLESLNIVLSEIKRIQSGEDSYFKEAGKVDWFAVFHKLIRQTDFFNDCYREERELMEEKDRAEYLFLTQKVRTDGYDKSDPEKKTLFNDEYRRYLYLSKLKRRETSQVSITGRLDSILWNFIHMDQKNYLYKIMLEVFEDEE